MSKSKRSTLTAVTTRASALPPTRDAELLDQIKHEQPTGWRDLSALRPHPAPSRPLDPLHVINMAHSIAALGVIQPLAVDLDDVVIAGNHRLAALRLLAAAPDARLDALESMVSGLTAKHRERLGPMLLAIPTNAQADLARIPIRHLALRQAEAPEVAWQVEVAENERRKDYKPVEIRAIAERLKANGYRSSAGGPPDAKRVLPVLTALVGKSDRTIRRILSGDDSIRSNDRMGEAEAREAAEREAVVKALKRLRERQGGKLPDALLRSINRVVDGLERLEK